MERIKVTDLYASLDEQLACIQESLAPLKQLDDTLLSTAPAAGKWSVCQVIEHLNTYNRYYLPLVKSRILAAKENARDGAMFFKPGILGNYFTKLMYSEIPSKSKVSNPMKAAKIHQPVFTGNAGEILADFEKGQTELLTLLRMSQQVNVTAIKVPISIAPFLKISVGDAFRFLVAHQVRHFLQVKNTLATLQMA